MNAPKYIAAFLFVLLAVTEANGQDLHYSMFDLSPMNLNPGTTGQFDGDYRFSANHRHQWRAVTIPYSTFSFGLDARDITEGNNIHAGLQVNQDRAGDSRFSTFMASANIGYSKFLKSDSSLTLSVGIQPGVTNRTIDYTDLRFDVQYNGWTYNPSLPNSESFLRDSRTYFNLATGAVADYQLDEKKSFRAGFSLFNLTTPKQSFFNEEAIRLDLRWVLHGSGSFFVSEKLDILPSFLFMGQGTFRELIIGSKVRYTLKDQRGMYRAIYGGTYYRNRDAGYLMVGMDYDNWKFGLSYDVNVSTLRYASNGRGALELALIYILKVYDPQIIQRRICRDFM